MQQKVNFVDSRLRSAEHSSELDALLSLARELRVFDARCAIVCALRARGRKGEGSDDWLLMNDY